MAVVLPVLLVIVLGILDFGRAINYWNDETHVANLAARYAAVGQLPTDTTCGTGNPQWGTSETLTQYIQCELGVDSTELANGSGSKNGPQSAVCIAISVPTTAYQPVTVTLSSKYQWLPMVGGLPLTSSTIRGSATQELENPTPAAASWANANTC
jgi:Flp pilus assembly protein TadG